MVSNSWQPVSPNILALLSIQMVANYWLTSLTEHEFLPVWASGLAFGAFCVATLMERHIYAATTSMSRYGLPSSSDTPLLRMR